MQKINLITPPFPKISFLGYWHYFCILTIIASFILIIHNPDLFFRIINSLIFVWILMGFGKLIIRFKK